ncbi:MAG: hypothetical protein EHM14_01320 [Methanothrix sp.]|nr:MAG: hypothetical protein EHM14_01320 [Methanothrix sp.]
MDAKQTFAITVLLVATIGLSVAGIPDLVGNWTGSLKGYDENAGYMDINKTGNLNMVISEQKGQVFAGNFSINFSSSQTGLMQETEGFSGAIGSDNKTLYFAEYDHGYDMGTILSNDTIEAVYIEDGAVGKAGAYVAIYHRMK